MTLRIGKLLARCRVPRTIAAERAGADLAGTTFARDCANQLAPRWPANDAVWRIRRLPIQVRLTPQDWKQGRLQSALATALVRALLPILAGSNPAARLELAHAPSRAAWLARWIADVLSGKAHDRWEYAEFELFQNQAAGPAVLAALLAEASRILDTLTLLDQPGVLERLLALWDEHALQQLAAAIEEHDVPPTATSVHELVRVAEELMRLSPFLDRARIASRRTALLIALRLRQRSTTSGPGPQPSPQRAWLALCLLHSLLETQRGTADMPSLQRRIAAELGTNARPVLDVLGDLFAAPEELATNASLNTALESLRKSVTSATPRPLDPATGMVSLATDWAGVFLLVGMLERLDWPRRMRWWLESTGTPGVSVSRLFAGLTLAILSHCEPPVRLLDRALSLFCTGQEDASLDPFALPELDEHQRLDLLGSLLTPDSPRSDDGSTWSATFNRLAERLLREFAERLRGFQRSTSTFLVRRFLAMPGRVQVAPRLLTVVLNASTLQVALRVSGADERVESVSWLGGRDVIFQLEGLS